MAGRLDRQDRAEGYASGSLHGSSRTGRQVREGTRGQGPPVDAGSEQGHQGWSAGRQGPSVDCKLVARPGVAEHYLCVCTEHGDKIRPQTCRRASPYLLKANPSFGASHAKADRCSYSVLDSLGGHSMFWPDTAGRPRLLRTWNVVLTYCMGISIL